MALALHNLKKSQGRKAKKKKVGRGFSSGSGKYSGRGLKGQRSRSGGKGGLKLKGLKANIQNIPKLPGFKSIHPKKEIVNLSDLNKNFKDGDKVTVNKLIAKGLINSKKPGVKLLANGELKKKLTVIVDFASDAAIKAVEKAGGVVKTTAPQKQKSETKAEKKDSKEEKGDKK